MFLGFHELRAYQGAVCWQITPENACTVVLDPLEAIVGPVAGFWGQRTGAGEAEKPQKRRFARKGAGFGQVSEAKIASRGA